MTETEFNLHKPQPLLIVISGPSGVGKDSVVQGLKNCQFPIHFVVTATTRPRRQNEVHGVDYFFLTKDEFARMIEQDEFIEYAIVYNDYKGIPKQQVREALSSGKDVLMRVDVQGADIDHVRWSHLPGAPSILLRDVSDVSIRLSTPVPDIHVDHTEEKQY